MTSTITYLNMPFTERKINLRRALYTNMYAHTAKPATYFCQIYLNILLAFTLWAPKFEG
jgi:hypothetical protein